MKYRSITLNGNTNHRYSLVKYTDKYKKQLKELKKIDSGLATCIERQPEIYSELSEHQSYMILCDESYCVGAIMIGTSATEKDLEIEIKLDEKHFNSRRHIFLVIDQIIDSLGLYFCDKENIEIKLLNNLDLSEYNRFKYKKRIYGENLTTYIYSNKHNNTLIPRLIREIEEAEKILTSWGQSWEQQIDIDNYQDLSYEIDKQLIKEYENQTISMQELFYKAESLLWRKINSNKSSRRIKFSSDGNVHLSKLSKEQEGIKYKIDYNVLSDNFLLQKNKYCRSLGNIETLEINEDSYFTNIKYNDIKILYDKDTKRKRINYTSPVVNNSSIEIELWLNEQEELENCYIDFRTHKRNGKINGLYALRIKSKSKYDKFRLNFISRKGNKSFDLTSLLSKNILLKVFYEELTFDLIEKIIDETILVVNRFASVNSKPTFTKQSGYLIMLDLMDAEIEAINSIKQIKDEIPLPHLQENLEKFIEAHSKGMNDDTKRILKR